jgi:hypothetical protein
MKPRSFALQVANWILFGVGLWVLGLLFLKHPRTRLFASVAFYFGILAFERAYKMAKARRLQRYAQEIERRMQIPPKDGIKVP